jgi:hypothetical protein
LACHVQTGFQNSKFCILSFSHARYNNTTVRACQVKKQKK